MNCLAFFLLITISVATEIAWKIPMNPTEISVPKGDKLKFTWTGKHNVFAMKNKEHYDACNFTDAVHVGEGQHSHRGRRTSTETSATAVMGSETMYFSCSIEGHCQAKQILTVYASTDAASQLYVTSVISIGAIVATTLALM